MNEKFIEIFNEIFSSKELLSKFMCIDDADELYKFCLSIRKGYSQAEFENFLMQLADECLLQTESLEAETEKVAGGKNNFKKFVSGSLAAVTILSSTGVKAANTGSNSKADSGYTELTPLEKDKPQIIKTQEKSFFTKVKEKFKAIGKKIWNNKGKIAIGAVIIAAIAGTAFHLRNNAKKAAAAEANNKDGQQNSNGNNSGKSTSIISSIFGLGTLGLTSTMLLVDKLANFLGGISKIGKTTKQGMELFNSVKNNGEMFGKYLSENEKKTFEEREKDFYEHLKYVRGQDAAVKKLKEILQDISKSEQIAKESEKQGKSIPKRRPRVIILNGPSGSGKTLCAEMLAKVLSPNGEYRKVAAQNIKYDGSKNTKDATPSEELFNYRKNDYFGSGRDNLGKYAAKNPNGVAIIDEYDKIGLGNGYSGVMDGRTLHPLDATFQSIYDNGCYESSNSDKVSLENFTFILTTNEQNKNLGLPKESDVDDQFESFRTNPLHSSHFIDRFKASVVTFNHLDKNAFKQIAEDDLKCRLDLNMTLDCCGKCNFKIKNDVYDKIASYIMELRDEAAKSSTVAPPSARLIVDYYNGISADVITKINDFYKDKQQEVAKNLFKKYGKELKMSEDDIIKKLAFIPGKMTFKIDFNYSKDQNTGKISKKFTVECTSKGDYSDNNLENLKNMIKKNK